MPMKKDYVTPSTGATASYHVVQMVALDAIGKGTSVAVYSYLSADARAAGKAPMYTQQLQIGGLPPSGTDAFAYAEQQLAAAEPADVSPTVPVVRYAFAGAEIVD